MDNQNAIAIVGMALRFPGADDRHQFWQNLCSGKESIETIDAEELLARGASPGDLAKPNYVRRVSALRAPELFDAEFFGMTSREAQLADPQLRILLQVCHEAIEDSGHVLSGTRTAVYVGVADNDFWLSRLIYNHPQSVGASLGNRVYIKKDYFATQLSHKLNLLGPSVSVSTACSTALVAVEEACTHLLMYDCDYAVAGGCEIDQRLGYLWEDGGITSKDGYCRAFSADANGTVFGSGCGVVVLRRYEDAVRDGDQIHAVILSCRINNDGRNKAGFTAPSVMGQAQLIHETIQTAGVSAADISYVEAHGTGTLVGDPIEIQALSQVFRRFTGRKGYCAIGSVKTNVGHLSVTAGVAGLIKAALALQHRTIPPIVNFSTPNPQIDFDNSPFYVNTQLRQWETDGRPRVAGVSAFGIGGTNAHAVLQEAPARGQSGQSRSCVLLPLSAKSEPALRQARQNLCAFLEQSPDISLPDVAYTLQLGRAELPLRTAVVHDEANGRHALAEEGAWITGAQKAADALKVAFMFPGQGSQHAGMTAGLYAEEASFKSDVDTCAELLNEWLDLDIRQLLYPSDADRARAQELITQTRYAQPALFVSSYATARLLLSWGLKPDVLIGHSIGEYVAACLAGVFTLPDALRIIAARGRLMQSARPGSMLSVAASVDKLSGSIPDGVDLAVINGAHQCVLGGETETLRRLALELAERKIRSQMLATSHAFHTRMMDEVLKPFEREFAGITLLAPSADFVSNVTGRLITAEQAVDPKYWVEHLRSTVRFADGVDTCVSRGIHAFVEVGPGAALTTLVRQRDLVGVQTLRHVKSQEQDMMLILRALASLWTRGCDIDWSALHRDAKRQRLSLPTYPFQQKRYWLDAESTTAPTLRVGTALAHPLLGQRWSSSKAIKSYENVVGGDSPAFLADHRLLQSIIFPGAGYCEMALGAAFLQFGERPVRIERIQFERALILQPQEGRALQTIVYDSGGTQHFEITSATQPRDPGGQPKWQVHSTGALKALPRPVRRTIDLPSLRERIATAVDMDAFYANESIQYGPSFRALSGLWSHGNEALGRVELPEMLRASAAAYRFHPVLLDACFQAVGALGGREGGLALPVGLIGADVYGRVPERCWVHMTLGASTAADVPTDVRFVVLDDAGTVLAQIEQYQRKDVTRAQLQEPESLEELFYEVAWIAQERSASALESAASSAEVVVLTDDMAAAQTLRERLPDTWRCSIEDYTCDGAVEAVVSGACERAAAQLGRRVEMIMMRVAEREIAAEDLCDVLLRATQELDRHDAVLPQCRLALITRGSQAIVGSPVTSRAQASGALLWGFGSAIAKEYPQLQCLRIDVDSTSALPAAMLAQELARGTSEDLIAYRGLTRYVARLRSLRKLDAESSAEPYRVAVSELGTFDSLRRKAIARRSPGPMEVEVELHAAGLNFKETLITLGMLGGSRSPEEMRFGFEGAGQVVAVGAEVRNVAPGDGVIVWANGCLATHITVPATNVLKVAFDKIGVEQAAGLPTVFMTAQYALARLTSLRPGDRVLIHAAAGGVGQAAVRLARAAGAEIFATASRPKWEFLAEQGIKHIFDSRSLDFVDGIRRATEGRGVDVVLNSLTGDFIQKSFDALARNGRFIEIGKLNIWSTERARAYRSDVDYHAFELGVGEAGGSDVLEELLRPVWRDLEAGRIEPLPIRVFTAEDIVPAFRWLASGRNVGKAIIRICDPATRAHASRTIEGDKQYVVTGGLGALGLHVAEWLVERGARDVSLLSRRSPDETVSQRLEGLRRSGATIRVVSCDAADREKLADLFGQLPSLGGIFHCAGVLDDGVVRMQTRARVAKVLHPKVQGLDVLHDLTRERALDYFVCFSSTSALIDGAGQCNYAAANAYMDSFVSYRRALGLPALSINWGAWAGPGMAAGLAARKQDSAQDFLEKEEALAGLDALLASGRAHAVFSRMRGRLATGRSTAPLFEELKSEARAEQVKGSTDFEGLLTECNGDPAAAAAKLLRGEVGKLLGVAATEVGMEDSFIDAGIDSLALAELRNSMNKSLSRNVPLAAFLAHPTVAALSQHIAREYLAAAEPVRAPQTAAGSGSRVITLKSSVGPNLFCFPGVGNNIFDFQQLAETQLERTLCVLHAGEYPLTSMLPNEIVFLAKEHVAAIRATQADGPYHLLGYSFGGTIAVEAARQLLSAGQELASLSLMDAVPSFWHRADTEYRRASYFVLFDSILDSLGLSEDRARTLYPQLMNEDMRESVSVLRQIVAERSVRGFGVETFDTVVADFLRRVDIDYQAPEQLGSLPITFFKASKALHEFAQRLGLRLNPRLADPQGAYGWEHILRNRIRIVHLSCTHGGILKRPYIEEVASVLSDPTTPSPRR